MSEAQYGVFKFCYTLLLYTVLCAFITWFIKMQYNAV